VLATLQCQVGFVASIAVRLLNLCTGCRIGQQVHAITLVYLYTGHVACVITLNSHDMDSECTWKPQCLRRLWRPEMAGLGRDFLRRGSVNMSRLTHLPVPTENF
jgi:hypothetical protein